MDKTKNGHQREIPYRSFGEFRLFDFSMLYHSSVFSEPGSSDLLWFTHQSFLASPAHLIYYVLTLNRERSAQWDSFYVKYSIGGKYIFRRPMAQAFWKGDYLTHVWGVGVGGGFFFN